MNKYTLKFYNQWLEDRYLEAYYNMTDPVFYYLSITGTIMFTAFTILALIMDSENIVLIIFYAFFAITYIILYFILKQGKQYTSIWLIVLLQLGITANYLSKQYQVECESILNITQVYFMFYMIFGFLIRFIYSMMNIVFTIITIVLLINILHVQYDLSIFINCGALIMFFIITRYKFEQMNRNSFLVALKEQQWEHIVTKVVQKPFILFVFDTQQFCFNLKLAASLRFSCSNNQEFRDFLRQSTCGKENLEQYFYRVQKDSLQLTPTSKSINIILNKSSYQVNYTAINLVQNEFLLVFNEDSQIVTDLQRLNNLKYKQLITKFQDFLRNVLLMMKAGIEKKNKLDLIFQQLSECSFYQEILFHKKSLKFEIIDFNHFINYLNERSPHKTFIIQEFEPSMKVSSILPLLGMLISRLSGRFKDKVLLVQISQSNLQGCPVITLNNFENNDSYLLINKSFKICEYTQIHSLFKPIAQKICLFATQQMVMRARIYLNEDSPIREN